MANYKFQGRSESGQLIEGAMSASSQDIVATSLLGQGVTPIKIIEVVATESFKRKIDHLLGADKIKNVEMIMFCRQMYTITKSGIPLVRGIRGLAASLSHLYFREVLNDIAARLETGMTLSASMAKHPTTFNNLFISMIAVGESSGSLDEVFLQLGYYIERDDETMKGIKSALRYPIFVLCAIVAAIAIVNIFVIPEFSKMFEKFSSDLPIMTKILIGTSNVFVHYWWLMILVLAAIAVFVVQFIKTDYGQQFWGEKKLRMPIAGDIIERASMARYTRSFSLMMRTGVPLNQALTLCSRAIDNAYLQIKIDNIRVGIERGESLLRTHQVSQMFSPLVLQMIAVGEESGQVEELLAEVAGFYEREVDYDIKKLSAKIEPILIIFMALMVGVLALGIFLPMWGMHSIQTG